MVLELADDGDSDKISPFQSMRRFKAGDIVGVPSTEIMASNYVKRQFEEFKNAEKENTYMNYYKKRHLKSF